MWRDTSKYFYNYDHLQANMVLILFLLLINFGLETKKDPKKNCESNHWITYFTQNWNFLISGVNQMGGKNLTEQTFEILKLQSELRGIFIYILYFLKTKLDLESFSSWLNCHVPTTTFSCYNHAWPDYNFNRVLCSQWKMALIVVIQDYARIFHV